MNTLMYEHPLTAEHLRVVKHVIGYNVVGPIGKALACGDIGTFCISIKSSLRELEISRNGRYDGMERYCGASRR
jgi:phosphopantothenoylcysteine decarboxylase